MAGSTLAPQPPADVQFAVKSEPEEAAEDVTQEQQPAVQAQAGAGEKASMSSAMNAALQTPVLAEPVNPDEAEVAISDVDMSQDDQVCSRVQLNILSSATHALA